MSVVLGAFFRALPLALPLMLATTVVGTACAGRIARRWRSGVVSTWLLLIGVGCFVALTMTPSAAGLGGNSSGSSSISLDLIWPSAQRLTSVSSETLNIAAGALLGLGAMLAALETRRHDAGGVTRLRLLLVGLAISLPVLAELWQWAVPALDRAGFLAIDVLLTWIGVAIGVAVAAIIHLGRAVIRGQHSAPDPWSQPEP